MTFADPHNAPLERTIAANGLSFRTLTWGVDAGRPALLLHGFAQSAETWQPVGEALAVAGFRAIAFDQRGYCDGARPADPVLYNFQQFVADALGVADQCGMSRFDVAGFGMGGAQAWILAARHSPRVRSLVALRFPHPAAFAAGIRNEPSQREAWARLQRDFGAHDLTVRAQDMLKNDAARLRSFLAGVGLPEPHLSRIVERLRQPGALVAAMSWEHSAPSAGFEDVPTVRVPTLYVWSRGPALSAATVAATRAHVAAPYIVEELEGAGNFMLETSADRVSRAMLDFYRRIETDSG